MSAKDAIKSYLDLAEIEINGCQAHDIQVHDEALYPRLLKNPSLGLGEGYMDQQRTCDSIDEFISRLLQANLDVKFYDQRLAFQAKTLFEVLKAKVFNHQSRTGSRKVINEHYELPAELYMNFLDPYNQYTCGYFKDTEDLDTAQIQKMDLIAQKLVLGSDDHLLDIGCGRGGFAMYVAKKYGCRVTGVSISDRQIAFAKSACKDLPVEIMNCDYRDLSKVFDPGSFDKVSVIGMIEHVGPKNYLKIMKQIAYVMKDDGLFLLHSIGSAKSLHKTEPFIDKYIFPNGVLPSQRQISKAAEGLFIPQHMHNFGPYYDPTLMARYRNFLKNRKSIKEIKREGPDFDERFKRKREYYLLSCAGGFRAGHIQLFHNVYSKQKIAGGYDNLVDLKFQTR